MTILYPILHYPPVIGGLEQWAENIATRQPHDIEVFIVTGRVDGQPNFEKIHNVSIFRTSLFSLHDLSHSSIFYIIGAIPFIFLKSRTISHRYGVRLFHCHGFISAIIGCALSRATGKSFIGTEQSLGWAESKSKWLRRFVYKRAETCIAASNAVAEEFRRIGVEKIEIIPNGVDVEKFRREKCRECNVSVSNSHTESQASGMRKSFSIVSVGRLEKVKGHTYLLEAFALIKKDFPASSLVLAGDGSERKSLEQQAAKLGLKENIEFAGEVSRDLLPHYYHKADVFIMPSISEGFGIAVIEAMASGIPVVAANVGSLAELVDDKKNGLLVESKNFSSIREAVRFIFNNKEARESFIKEGLLTVQNYSWDAIALRISSFYRSVDFYRILIISSIAPPDIGGPSYYARNLEEELEKSGRHAHTLNGSDARSFGKIFFELKNFEICYVMSSSPKVFAPAFFAAKFRGRKVAVRIGGDFLWERAVDSGRTSMPLGIFYEEYKKSFKEWLVFFVLGFLFRHCDFVIFTSDFLKERYARHYKIPGPRMHIIENPYPLIKKSERNFPEGDLVIVYAGRLIKLKNIDMLLYALADVKEQAPRRVVLKIIGSGPEEERMMRLANTLGIGEDVSFSGAVSRSAILEEIQNSWLVVLPSLSEVTPNLVFESCAAGTPVVVTRENGLPEKVSANLLICNPTDTKELDVILLSLFNEKRWADYQKEIFRMDTSRSFRDLALDHIKLFACTFAPRSAADASPGE